MHTNRNQAVDLVALREEVFAEHGVVEYGTSLPEDVLLGFDVLYPFLSTDNRARKQRHGVSSLAQMLEGNRITLFLGVEIGGIVAFERVEF